jgi:hypothetical protein
MKTKEIDCGNMCLQMTRGWPLNALFFGFAFQRKFGNNVKFIQSYIFENLFLVKL